ncbi:glucose-1-phosphate thymidylyltransferase [Streptomyces sp. NRRL S-1022]|uniref:glucose-1-phosphate thymidylyltransferase n=1 Tax=Streptomyces sp. NRRL S-1022 TaxID=1463880 RepID=UPI0004C2865B|nr:glucose-1-phosphate thymidylyltransferase [Streptomyces sp. NRRL S-1022]
MKALVLAGGTGSRLRPITHTSAKQLVPIGNKPVLFYGLEAIRDSGIREVGIIVGETGAEVRRAVGDGSRFGLSVTYIPQEAPLGLAHCVLIAREFLGDDDFLMYLGDNFVIDGIRGFVAEFLARRPDAQLLLTKVANPSEFGVAELDEGGRVVRVEEKPREPRSDLALVGIYMFTPLVHRIVARLRPSERGELEITEAIQNLILQQADVSSHTISGYWKDTGRVEDMLECNRMVLENIVPRMDGSVDDESEVVGRLDIAEDAVVIRSRVVGPVSIGPGTVVADSYVGPFTSVGAGCRLDHTEIEYSIVMERSSISGVSRIQNSLIGKDVEVSPAGPAPRGHQLVVGDHSRVRLNY